MEFRGVTIPNVFVANFLFVAGIGMTVTAQWELSAGNGFAYTVFSAFGMRPFPSDYRAGAVADANISRPLLRWVRGNPYASVWD